MDEKLIQEKIAQLQSAIEKQNKRFRSAATRTGLIMLLLVLVVLGYTTFLYKQLTELATPQNMAALLVQQGKDQLPAVRDMIRTQMTPCAEMLAQKGVTAIGAMIPTAGQYSRNLITQVSKDQLEKVKAKLMPQLEETLNSALQIALEEKNTGSVSDAIAKQAGEAASAEIKKLLNRDFYQSIADLQNQLTSLQKKQTRQLTRRDASERMAIAAMLRLAELAQNDSSTTPVASMAGLAEDVAAFLSTEISEK